MTGGRIGADITLRDTTLPTDQAELDEFAEGLSSRFVGQGLTLFTDGSPNVPTPVPPPAQNGYVGYAGTIQVNPQVTADPSLVRDGTDAVAAIGFTPNDPAIGPAGFTTLISNVLNYTFGSQSQSGDQPALNTNGLGQSGNLAAPFSSAPGESLSDFATSLVSSQAQQSATATSNLTTEQALQTSLNAKATAVSGVNMDTEVSQMLSLQNAYGANARVVAGVQSMFAELLQAVQ
jgi:flagellar hook-associated protein 1